MENHKRNIEHLNQRKINRLGLREVIERECEEAENQAEIQYNEALEEAIRIKDSRLGEREKELKQIVAQI